MRQNDSIPLISAIVPLFNAAKYLDVCVRHLLEQTFTNFELILVDDGSTDGTLETCRRLANIDTRIKVLHQDNAGVSAARNIGLEHATGDYIAFIDSDDLIALDFFEYLLEKIEDSSCILSMCGHERIYDYGYEFQKVHVQFKMIPAIECSKRLLCGYFPVSACGCLFKKQMIGDIRFPAGIRNNEDKLFLYQYLLKNETGTVAFSNEKLYGYFVRDGSATRSSWNGSLDIVRVADQIREDTAVQHPEWDGIARNACLGARIDVMKAIVCSEKTVHGKKTYDDLKKEVLSCGWPQSGSNRRKAEYFAIWVGKPAFTAMVKTYYNLNKDKKRFKLNEERTKQ